MFFPAGARRTERHIAGLRISLAPAGRPIGAAPETPGIPPLFSLSASNNLAALRVAWPVPDGLLHQRDDDDRLRNRGDPAGGFHGERSIRADRAFGRDRGRGLPERTSAFRSPSPVSGVLPPTGGPDPAIRAAIADRPMTEDRGRRGGRVSCDISPIDDGLAVAARVELPRFGEGEVRRARIARPARSGFPRPKPGATARR